MVVTAGPIVEDPDSPLGPDWLGDWWLALPIDFDFYVSRDTVAAADLFLVDDIQQFEYYRSLGHFAALARSRGIVGEEHDRRSRVLCCNLGVGALDAAFAAP